MDINYRVHVTPNRVFVKVLNKASYLNCEPMRKFFDEQNERGCNNFIIDFQSCSSMDSTFLGILVSVAIKVRKSAEGGSFTLLNLRGRNLETVCNLGIHQIADISSDEVNDVGELENLSSKPSNLNANVHTIYKAHKALMSLNEKNLRVFSDVVSYLEQKNED